MIDTVNTKKALDILRGFTDREGIGAEYFFSLKGNQPSIQEKAKVLLDSAFPPQHLAQAWTEEKWYGRLETRELWVSSFNGRCILPRDLIKNDKWFDNEGSGRRRGRQGKRTDAGGLKRVSGGMQEGGKRLSMALRGDGFEMIYKPRFHGASQYLSVQ